MEKNFYDYDSILFWTRGLNSFFNNFWTHINPIDCYRVILGPMFWCLCSREKYLYDCVTAEFFIFWGWNWWIITSTTDCASDEWGNRERFLMAPHTLKRLNLNWQVGWIVSCFIYYISAANLDCVICFASFILSPQNWLD